MKFKHKNLMSCATVLYDSKGNGHELLPGDSVVLDIKREWKNKIEVEKVKQIKIKKESEL